MRCQGPYTIYHQNRRQSRWPRNTHTILSQKSGIPGLGTGSAQSVIFFQVITLLPLPPRREQSLVIKRGRLSGSESAHLLPCFQPREEAREGGVGKRELFQGEDLGEFLKD